MISYKLPFARLFCAALVAVLSVGSSCSMDHCHNAVKTSQSSTSTLSQKFITPEYLLRKPWIRQVLICASMIANFCRYYEADNEYDIQYPDQNQFQPKQLPVFTTQSHVMQIPRSVPQAISLNPATLDDISIKKYYERDKQTLEDAFAQAKKKKKNLVHVLNNQSLYKVVSRIRLMYGEPGVGKSTLARAIAYKAGWYVACICGRQIRGEHRGSTSIKLQQKLESIVAQHKNTVIIIDEMNRLFEEYNNSNFDTGDTAEDFWTFLDSQEDNQQLYIIGTMNNVDKLPPQIQSRARGSWIKLTRPDAITGTVTLFKRMCMSDQYVLDQTCTDSELTNFLTPLHGKWTPRDYQLLISQAIEIAREANPIVVPVSITTAHLELSKADIQVSDTDTKYGNKHETREDIEERRHKENITMHRDNFVKGVLIQRSMHANQSGSSKSGGFNLGIVSGSYTSSANSTGLIDDNITNNLSDDEIKIYREQQQLNTRRNNELKQVQTMMETVRKKIEYLKTARQKLALIDSDEVRAFNLQIGRIITYSI